ncbi:MAG: PcfJ domain-containing protein [Clostridiales bacterium]|nr:PcfJ domain-containing protein [Clostridiales bacterium]
MKDLTGFERMISRCPEVDCDDLERYPLASRSEFSEMERKLGFPCVFFFERIRDDESRYIEIYIWDPVVFDGEEYRRFIIEEGMCLPEDLEKELMRYARRGRGMLLASDGEMRYLCDVLREYFPYLNYCGYEDPGKAIEHIYYASHRSGPKEILYKAGLDNIAYDLEIMEHYNFIGRTPSEIVGHNAPLRLLRILNQDGFQRYYTSEEMLRKSIDVYSHFAGAIGDGYPNIYQWYYLEGLLGHGLTGVKDIDRDLYQGLATVVKEMCSSQEFEGYFSIIETFRKLGLKEELHRFLSKPDHYKMHVGGRVSDPLTVEMFDLRAKSEAAFYGYTDGVYFIRYPKTPMEMVLESYALRNCLGDYVYDQAEGETTILFIRKCSSPDASFVAMEVNEGEIVQVRAFCNAEPDPDVMEFVEGFAKAKGLVMDSVEAA